MRIQFLIVLSDCPQYGDDAKGMFLVRFLWTSCQMQPQHLDGIAWDHVYLFDYDDSLSAFPLWFPTDVVWLRTLTRIYFKTCVMQETQTDMNYKVLPFFLIRH